MFRIVHLETWDQPAGTSDRSVADTEMELDRLAAALAAVEVPEAPAAPVSLRLYAPAVDEVVEAEAQTCERSSQPGDRNRLPEMRVRFARRRQQSGDQAFGRVAELEANLERLVAELEVEVDRLEGASALAVHRQPPSA
ncbi:MAG: hypothetical protein K2Y37_18860 [Pirellulales bacterium]|nr:hypothetical protein [Pirellulales bacterium]